MSKLSNPLGSVSVLAGQAIDKQLFVGFDGHICAANAKALGVSELSTESGEYAGVIFAGVALVKSGGAVTAGSAIVSDASGKAIAATNLTLTIPSGATQVTSTSAQPAITKSGCVLPQSINGYALDAASAADEVIRIILV